LSVGAPGVDAERLGAAFAELSGAFEDAAARVGVSEHHLRLGGQRITLQIAGDAVASGLLPALAHLEQPAGAGWSTDLRIRAWDTAASETSLPDLPGEFDGMLGRAQHAGDIHLSFQILESAISALHVGEGEALHCVADARRLAPNDIAYPLSEILGWWMSRSGCYLVHGAAVGTARGGVLLAGSSGAGKSTSALTCQRAGMRFAGDDSVLVQTEPPVVFSPYRSARADRELLARYRDVLPRLEEPSGDEKMVGFFPREAMTAELPLSAVVLPRVVPGGRCRIVPASRAAALLAMAPWVTLHVAGGAEQALRSTRAMLSRLPVHGLEVGDDLASLPSILSELIEATA